LLISLFLIIALPTASAFVHNQKPSFVSRQSVVVEVAPPMPIY